MGEISMPTQSEPFSSTTVELEYYLGAMSKNVINLYIDPPVLKPILNG